jgi:hypothetical protein
MLTSHAVLRVKGCWRLFFPVPFRDGTRPPQRGCPAGDPGCAPIGWTSPLSKRAWWCRPHLDALRAAILNAGGTPAVPVRSTQVSVDVFCFGSGETPEAKLIRSKVPCRTSKVVDRRLAVISSSGSCSDRVRRHHTTALLKIRFLYPP